MTTVTLVTKEKKDQAYITHCYVSLLTGSIYTTIDIMLISLATMQPHTSKQSKSKQRGERQCLTTSSQKVYIVTQCNNTFIDLYRY